MTNFKNDLIKLVKDLSLFITSNNLRCMEFVDMEIFSEAKKSIKLTETATSLLEEITNILNDANKNNNISDKHVEDIIKKSKFLLTDESTDIEDIKKYIKNTINSMEVDLGPMDTNKY